MCVHMNFPWDKSRAISHWANVAAANRTGIRVHRSKVEIAYEKGVHIPSRYLRGGDDVNEYRSGTAWRKETVKPVRSMPLDPITPSVTDKSFWSLLDSPPARALADSVDEGTTPLSVCARPRNKRFPTDGLLIFCPKGEKTGVTRFTWLSGFSYCPPFTESTKKISRRNLASSFFFNVEHYLISVSVTIRSDFTQMTNFRDNSALYYYRNIRHQL